MDELQSLAELIQGSVELITASGDGDMLVTYGDASPLCCRIRHIGFADRGHWELTIVYHGGKNT